MIMPASAAGCRDGYHRRGGHRPLLGIFRSKGEQLKKTAVGFYWTLPVPWAGFAKLPSSVDAAAEASRTIRFQRELIRQYAGENGLVIAHEAAFLEIDPDRGSDLVHAALDRAAAECRRLGAILLFVDFSSVQGWRSHEPMMTWLREADVDALPIDAVAITMDGVSFDPHDHFSDWRARQREWIDAKPERAAKALAMISALVAMGMKNAEIAQSLNEANVRSLSGKPWSADGVRKFMTSSHAQPSLS